MMRGAVDLAQGVLRRLLSTLKVQRSWHWQADDVQTLLLKARGEKVLEVGRVGSKQLLRDVTWK
jgi:hypothetical protein